HKNTERLFGSPAYTAPQLMQLGETKSLGIFDHHDGGIGYVDTDLNNGCGNHDLRFVPDKTLHLKLVVLHRHFAVNDADLILWQRTLALQVLQASLEINEIQFFAFFDQGIYYIYLAAFGNFLTHKSKHPQA